MSDNPFRIPPHAPQSELPEPSLKPEAPMPPSEASAASAEISQAGAAPEGPTPDPDSLPPPVTEVQAGWYNPAEPGKADQTPSQAGWRNAPELVPVPPPFAEQQQTAPVPVTAPPMMGPSRSWMALFSGLAWIVLCFELGAFLLVYPWMDGWDQNYFATLQPAWHDVWVNPWVRGAVSGLGTVNILIALIELFRYLRHWLFD